MLLQFVQPYALFSWGFDILFWSKCQSFETFGIVLSNIECQFNLYGLLSTGGFYVPKTIVCSYIFGVRQSAKRRKSFTNLHKTCVKHLNCKLYYLQLHLKYLCNLVRYWLQAPWWGRHDSVETCRSVIICEIIVHLLVIAQKKSHSTK
jgi:hypothetical protein